MTRLSVALTMSGAGSHLASWCGVVRGLRKLPIDFPIVAGASAGAARTTPMAYGVADDKVDDIVIDWLQSNRMIDAGPMEFVDGKLGVCGWHAVPRIVDEMIGPGRTLGEATSGLVIPVAQLRKGGASRIAYLSKEDTPNVIASEALRATTAIPFFASTVMIPSFMPGLFSDPGVKDNTADSVFDGAPIPRLAIRLKHAVTDDGPILPGNVLEQVGAVLDLALSAANRIKSVRRDGVVVDVPVTGNGFDFSLSVKEIKRRMRDAEAFIDTVADDIMRCLGVP